MSNISLDLIQKLRERSGVGIMDCKKALQEAEGDLEKAAELLRKKGMAVAAKRSANVTENGLIGGAVDADYKRATLVEIGCETDFAARTQDMRDFMGHVTDSLMVAGKEWASVEDFMAWPVHKLGLSVQSTLDGLISRISEKIIVARVEVNSSSDVELTNIYLHPDGTLGVLVTIAADKPMTAEQRQALAPIAKDICMQAAVTNPISIDAQQVDPAVLSKEREIALELLQNSGKPAQMLEKIVEGKLRKFFEENCLVEQKFIKDEQTTVGQHLANAGKQQGLTLKVVRSVRFGIKR